MHVYCHGGSRLATPAGALAITLEACIACRCEIFVSSKENPG
jgi:hypothetical protein